MLSNGQKYKNGDYVWVEVQPIRWYVEIDNDIVVAKNILFSNVPFIKDEEFSHYKFENTTYYWYLNTFFIKEIMNFRNKKKNQKNNIQEGLQPYNNSKIDYQENNSSIENLLEQANETIKQQADEIAALRDENARLIDGIMAMRNNIDKHLLARVKK